MEATSLTSHAQESKDRIRSFDFRQVTISKKKKESLDRIFEEFCQAIETTLMNYIGIPIKSKLNQINYMSFEEYLKSINKSILLSTFDIDPADMSGLFRLDAELVLVAVDRILGGDGKHPDKIRELSLIEQKMSEALINKIINRLSTVWQGYGEFSFKFKTVVQNYVTLKFAAPEEMMVVAGLNIKFNETPARMEVIFPFTFVKPILTALEKANYRRGGAEDKVVSEENDRERSQDIAVSVRAILGELPLSLSDLIQVERGDVIRLGAVNKDILLAAENVPIFFARPGSSEKRNAVELVKAINGPDDLKGKGGHHAT